MSLDGAAAGRKAIILFYNSFFGSYPDWASFPCSSEYRFTNNRELLGDADAVVFHLPQWNEIGTVPKRRGQIWVAWSMESRGHTPVRNDPAIMRFFDVQMTFERSADVWCSYLPKREEWEAAVSKPIPFKTGTAEAVMFQSAPSDLSGRNAYAAEFMKYMSVDSFGNFLRNKHLSVEDRGFSTKMDVVSRYKFSISFENTIENDYVTEKFFQPLLCGSVPIYMGAPNIDEFSPGDHCYIDVRKFSGPKALAAYLTDLARDEAEYSRYFEWRRKPLRPSFLRLLEDGETEAFCRLGQLVAQRLRRDGPA